MNIGTTVAIEMEKAMRAYMEKTGRKPAYIVVGISMHDLLKKELQAASLQKVLSVNTFMGASYHTSWTLPWGEIELSEGLQAMRYQSSFCRVPEPERRRHA